jgi:hypothetical protein
MSFLNWFSGKSARALADQELLEGDSLSTSRSQRVVPIAVMLKKGAENAGEGSAERKSRRHVKRELLYTAVREAMIRAGVLTSSYKFKVLSLDPRGDQFMVMMDLSREFGAQTERFSKIEVMIAQGAKSRYDIRVTAVYWRINELLAPGRLVNGARSAAASGGAEDLLDAAMNEELRKISAKPAAVVNTVPVNRDPYEPIQSEEVAAFKAALTSGATDGVATQKGAPGPRSKLHSYALLTGFEDTEMAGSAASAPVLSTTQYGDLN